MRRGLLRCSAGQWTRLPVDGEHAAAGFTTVSPAADGWLWMGAGSRGMVRVHDAD